MLVPGASGGSMAMILGIYDRLISSVSSFFKDVKGNFLFLALFCLGGGAGILVFARPLLYLIERFPMPMMYFFLGAVAGGVPLIFSQAEIKKVSWKVIVYILVGIFAVCLIGLIPEGSFQSDMEAGMVSYLMLVLAGIFAAVALVLPGISVSYLFLVMGMYDEIMRSISTLYLPFLLPQGFGNGDAPVSPGDVPDHSWIRIRLHGPGFPGDPVRSEFRGLYGHLRGRLLRDPLSVLQRKLKPAFVGLTA